MLRYIDTVLNPYLTSKRQELELADTHKALLIMDVFKVHRCEEVLQKLDELNVLVIFVPANCTDQLYTTAGPQCKQTFKGSYEKMLCKLVLRDSC